MKVYAVIQGLCIGDYEADVLLAICSSIKRATEIAESWYLKNLTDSINLDEMFLDIEEWDLDDTPSNGKNGIETSGSLIKNVDFEKSTKDNVVWEEH